MSDGASEQSQGPAITESTRRLRMHSWPFLWAGAGFLAAYRLPEPLRWIQPSLRVLGSRFLALFRRLHTFTHGTSGLVIGQG